MGVAEVIKTIWGYFASTLYSIAKGFGYIFLYLATTAVVSLSFLILSLVILILLGIVPPPGSGRDFSGRRFEPQQ